MINPATYDLSTVHIENMRNIANFIVSDKVPPPQFSLRTYLNFTNEINPEPFEIKLEKYHQCGTTACAIGHGPLMGLEAEDNEEWHQYSFRVFGCSTWYNTTVFQFLFGPNWDKRNNTSAGTSARILYFLEHGMPAEYKNSETARSCYHWEAMLDIYPQPWLEGIPEVESEEDNEE